MADEWVPPYEGDDMAGYLMQSTWEIPDKYRYGPIRSVTNIRDTAIIVMDYAIFRAKPSAVTGFCIERVAMI